MSVDEQCKGCRASVRVPPAEVQRILAEVLRDHPGEVVDDDVYRARMAACAGCGDLQYGTTCRHCGCLVAVRAKLADKHCPRPESPGW